MVAHCLVRLLCILLLQLQFPWLVAAVGFSDVSESRIIHTNSSSTLHVQGERKAVVLEILNLDDEESEEEFKLERVHFVFCDAPLQSGGTLEGCLEEECQGGVSAVSAYVRHLVPQGEPSLVLPKLQKGSQLVTAHPLGWSVNRPVLQGLMGWDVFMSTPSLLLHDQRDSTSSATTDSGDTDLSYLQNEHFPLLLSNVQIPPSNSWTAPGVHEYIHFHSDTGIALIVMADSQQRYNYPHAQAAYGLLNVIHHKNLNIGHHCVFPQQLDLQKEALYKAYQTIYPNGHTQAHQVNTTTTTNQKCWIPVILYYDQEEGEFDNFVDDMFMLQHRPAIILDASFNNQHQYSLPTRVSKPSNFSGPTRDIWIHSYWLGADDYFQHHITINTTDTPPTVHNLTYAHRDLRELPQHFRDETYHYQVNTLHTLAQQATKNDPIVGNSTAMPYQRIEDMILCNWGECQIGNLFTSAMQWKTQTDIAFIASGGLRGMGWEAGPVRLSDIWASLPFPNTICQGTISGLSLFKLLDYSIRVATFQPEQDNDADRLLQVAGLKITYNPNIPQGESRLVAVRVYHRKLKKWNDLSPTDLYTFSTDNYLCGSYEPFPQLTGAKAGSFLVPGEVGGVIGDILLQRTVQDYLTHLSEPYNTTLQGRITAEPNATDVLNLLQNASHCHLHEYFANALQVCRPCPDTSQVLFSNELLEFKHQLGRQAIMIDDKSNNSSDNVSRTTNETLVGNIVLINHANFNVTIVPKLIPSWIQLYDARNPTKAISEGQNFELSVDAGKRITVRALPPHVAGSSLGTVSVGVLGDETYSNDPAIKICDEFSRDVTFDVFLSVLPQFEENNLGQIRLVGLSLMVFVMLTAIGFALFVFTYRETRILKVMQPRFLKVICLGIFIMSSAIIPLSFDDGILTDSQCDAMCAAIPWLLSLGCTILFSVLFSKLWRINRLFHVQRFQRMTLTEKDVLGPFLALFSTNFVLLLTWTFVDPMQWTRESVKGEPWKTYGACKSEGVGYVFFGLIAALLFIALLMACHQAYKARDISDEFSEGKNLGMALFTWLQVMLVGLPSLFLVSDENFTARYFLNVGLIFVLSESMLMMIFLPLVRGVYQFKKDPESATHGGSVAVSGMGGNNISVPPASLTLAGRNHGSVSVSALNTYSGGLPQQSYTSHNARPLQYGGAGLHQASLPSEAAVRGISVLSVAEESVLKSSSD